MDRQKLNTIYNALKELVGEQGAFVLFAAAQGPTEPAGILQAPGDDRVGSHALLDVPSYTRYTLLLEDEDHV